MALSSVIRWIQQVTGRERSERRRVAMIDPWRRFDLEPPLRAFGPGAVEDFAAFLACHTRVAVRSPGDIAQWLLDCRYAEDSVLLDSHDLWQHPCTFEVVRSGDCEDYSLWAWRQLVGAGYDADFVVGMHRRVDGVSGRHAWVVFRDDGVDYVLDGVERTEDAMIRVVADVRDAYEPQVGVARDGSRFVFAGLFRTEWGQQLELVRRRERR